MPNTTSISSMSLQFGHPATLTVCATVKMAKSDPFLLCLIAGLILILPLWQNRQTPTEMTRGNLQRYAHKESVMLDTETWLYNAGSSFLRMGNKMPLQIWFLCFLLWWHARVQSKDKVGVKSDVQHVKLDTSTWNKNSAELKTVILIKRQVSKYIIFGFTKYDLYNN
jgi:hypothetical protein